jgi:hypothetical protein
MEDDWDNENPSSGTSVAKNVDSNNNLPDNEQKKFGFRSFDKVCFRNLNL